MHEILTVEEMAEADRRAIALGVPSLTLMENAGRAVADEAAKMVAPGARIAVLCGPGNNGGDGFVAARLLRERGFAVRVSCLVSVDQLKGDAAEMARRWGGEIADYDEVDLSDVDLIIDSIFGAGLSRPIDGEAADILCRMNLDTPVLAVDVPSGLNGTTGTYEGPVVHATRTITFFRKKPGHLLMPGRALCGEVVVADIGIPDVRGDARALHALHENHPSLWQPHFPWPRLDGHKYARGHAVVVSGPAFQSGAARLAARGALRMGAGLVTVLSPPSALPENAAHLTAIMLKTLRDARDLAEILEDKRKNAALIGPGCGVGEGTRELIMAALASGAAVVIDADALTSFAANGDAPAETVNFGFTGAAIKHAVSPESLFAAVHAKPDRPVVMTPHEGEFARLLGNVSPLRSSKLDRAREAARVSGATVVLKGPDTVIAAPDGRAAINSNAPPWLATAGSGDVLAGFITGLLAQAVPAFEAACAAVWLHGECATTFGPGLIAEDLPEVLPGVLKSLSRSNES